MSNLPTITKTQFIKKLKKNPNEKLDSIKLIESFLKKQRGYVFRMPKPGSPVIMMISGGLDSTTSWNILLEEFKLNVYPLAINRDKSKRRKYEKKSLKYFSSFYKNKYKRLYHQPVYLDVILDKLDVTLEQAQYRFHPKSIIENINAFGQITTNVSFGSFILYPIIGKLYAEYLYQTQQININTIFCSVTSTDGLNAPEQSLTSLRAGMLFLCQATGNYKWQFSSVAYEKETRTLLAKSDLISWASKHALPLEKTRTCHRNNKYHCGNQCMTCQDRRQSFKKAKVKDKTIYLDDLIKKRQEKINPFLDCLPGRLKNIIKSILLT